MLFNGPDNPRNVDHLIRGLLDSYESAPQNNISFGSAVFAQLTRVPITQTYTQTTLRVTSVAIARIYMYAVHGRSPNNRR